MIRRAPATPNATRQRVIASAASRTRVANDIPAKLRTVSTAGDSLNFRIRGMHCSGCVANAEAALRRCEGVAAATVNLTTEIATVEFAKNASTQTITPALVAAIRDAGYEAIRIENRDRDRSDARTRSIAELRAKTTQLVVATALAVPILAAHFLPHAQLSALGWHSTAGLWLQAAIAAAVMLIAGRDMLLSGVRAAMRLSGNMDVLVTLAAGISFIAGVAGILWHRHELAMFDAAALIILFVSLGKLLEARARRHATSAFEALADRLPRRALRLRDGKAEEVDAASILPGDLLLIAAPAAVPVDSEIVTGRIAVDESLLTGESLPQPRDVADRLIGGSVAVEGSATARALSTGGESTASKIAAMVEAAQARKTPWQRLADQVAGIFVPIVLALALLTFGGWLLAGAAPADALTRAVAVLVIACPCAMGLAIPTAVVVASSAAAARGVLVRDGETLEAAARLDTIAFDKTGTLTLGRPTLARVTALCGSETDALQIAASVEQVAQHPLAQAIVAAARTRGLALSQPTDTKITPGSGIAATLNGARVLVGAVAWMRESGIALPANDTEASPSATLVYLAVDSRLIARFELADEVHPSALRAVAAIHALGLHTLLLSGDRSAVATSVARKLGIQEVESELRPEQKLDRIRTLVESGKRVAMVGDGINDGPALAAATVGIAIGTGSDLARESAGICLVGHDPLLVAEAISLSRRAARVMCQNLVWAFGYNVVLIPIAALTTLSPSLAAAAMMLSSFSVVANSLRLRARAGVRHQHPNATSHSPR
ncbi:MAG: heavy metal translocating P-type ATPase [Phycisphaerae bacterium]